ncbi:MAG: ParB/RepB/Spo0J family partition protein [Clostridia bacterium]|nr:ParB/RepB/Spo0J family partition protein [Clostridia bacterium]
MSNIQYIAVEKITPHPGNPRRELGDLTELAASIKESGIFQNLTVVPFEDGYRVVIGHRRLAAAKLAGLTEVPCTVSDMDERKQAATMILENMQRCDLTVREQAEGFQMMLDLGHTKDEISEKTGLSASTVDRRLKLLELDRDGFIQATDRGATLSDFAELDKIKDTKVKNKLLDSIGTNNFRFDLRQAIQKQDDDEQFAKWKTYLDSFATEVKSQMDYERVEWLSVYSTDPPETIPEDADKVEYYYYLSRYDSSLLKKRVDNGKSPEQIERERKEQERKTLSQKLSDVCETARALRRNFVREYTGKNEHLKILIEYYTKHIMFNSHWTDVDEEDMAEICSIELPEDDEQWEEILTAELSKLKPRTILLAYIFLLRFDEGNGMKPYDYYNRFSSSKDLEDCYSLLNELGYQMSDEEKKLLDGTHELYVKGE